MIRLSLFSLLFACGEEEKSEEFNTRPEITSISITPESTTTTGTLSCLAEASDPDGDEVTLSYAWKDRVGNILSEDTELSITPEEFQPKERVYCWVTASDGTSSISIPKFLTIENTDPVVDAVEISVDTDSPRLGSTLSCSGTGSDIDLGTPIMSYTWTRDDVPVGSGEDLLLEPASFAEGDQITCIATTSDDHGGEATDTASITIGNSAPVVDLVTITPETPTSQAELMCAVEASDLDQEELSFSYAWEIDGVASAETGSSLVGPFLVGSEISCSVIANDGEESSESMSASTTIANSLPVVDSISFGTEDIYTDSTITATTELNDADAEHSPTANYEWHVIATDGTDSIVQTSDANTLEGSFFSKDEQVYVIVTPNDSIADGESLHSETITIVNSDPTLSNVAITSESTEIYNNEVLDCEATIDDADEGSQNLVVTYSWTSGEDVLGTDATLDLAAESLTPGDEISCTISVTDSDTGTTSVTIEETIGNRAPDAPVVTITCDSCGDDGEAPKDEDITCSATASDSDGTATTLSYVWTNDDDENAEPISEAELPSTATSAGESWTCTATASDGELESTGTATIEIVQ